MFLEVSCTITGMDRQDWERLGQRIVHRRVELGIKTREQFSQTTKLSTRLLQDLENGKRLSYSPGTLAVVERSLDWQAGSCRDVLFGLPPRPIDDPVREAEPPQVAGIATVSNRSIARLLIAGGRAKEAADAATARGSSEVDLISKTVEAYEAAAQVAVEHFGGPGQMSDLADALQAAQRVALQQAEPLTTNMGVSDESTSETTQASVPEDAREVGSLGTSKTRAADGGEPGKVHDLNRRKQGPDVDGRLPKPNPADFLAAQTIDPSDASLRPEGPDDENQDHGYDDPA